MDRRACQWAEGRVSGHKDVTVGTSACQWAQGCDNLYKGLSTGAKAFQVPQGILSGTYMYDWTSRCFKPAADKKILEVK